jgi:hypothetical protein
VGTTSTRSLVKGRILHLVLQVSELFVSADDVATGQAPPRSLPEGSGDPERTPRSLRGSRGCPLGDAGSQGRRHARGSAHHHLPGRRSAPGRQRVGPGEPPNGRPYRPDPGWRATLRAIDTGLVRPKGDKYTRRIRIPRNPGTSNVAPQGREPVSDGEGAERRRERKRPCCCACARSQTRSSRTSTMP